MKKVVSLLLCAVLLIGLMSVPAFAAVGMEFLIEADKTVVKPGDEVKFTVTVKGTEPCDQFGLIFDFDRDSFELVKGAAQASYLDEDEEEVVGVKTFNKTSGKEGIAVSFLEAVTYSGKVGYITLKVKEDAKFDTTSFTARTASNIGSSAVEASINVVELTMEHVHAWTEVAAVAPTCDTEGNIAYKYCECGEAWTLGENSMPLSRFGWILGATGHTWTEIAAVEPGCETEGNIAYQLCTACGAAQTAGENPIPLSKDGWILGVKHAWVEYPAVAPTCTADGNIAYQLCSACGAAQTAGEKPIPLSKDGWVLAAAHTGLEHYDTVAPSCGVDGHEAYDYCKDCQVFIYEDPLKLSFQDGVIPALAHQWVDYAAVEPTCDTEGNIAYQQCSVCGAAQTAGENPMPLSKYGWILGAVGHDWIDYAAVAPTCTADGNIAYQLCSACGAAQTAGENPIPLSKYGWVLAAEHTALEHHDAIAPSCGVDGHEAYDYCSNCQVFIYADPLKLSFQDGVIPALTHEWVEHEAVEPTCDLPGNVAYKQCALCGEAWTQGENPMPLGKDRWILAPIHSIKHVAAKAATAEAEGNVEYWYCEDCGYAWLDEAQTKVTNLKSVIIPKIVTPATADAAPVAAMVALAVMGIFGLALVATNKKRFIG